MSELRTEEAEFDPFYEGQDDFWQSEDGADPRKENPYAIGLQSYDSWMAGWYQAAENSVIQAAQDAAWEAAQAEKKAAKLAERKAARLAAKRAAK